MPSPSKIRITVLGVLIALFVIQTGVYSQIALDSKTKTVTVNRIAEILDDNYVFPETADKMGDYIKSQLSSGAYESITDASVFAEKLSADLQSISKDKHLRVAFSPSDAKRIIENQKKGINSEIDKQFIETAKYENYGFKKVERLSGNIGYVKFDNFAPAHLAKDKIESVMGFLSNSDAIIFDLRQNGGGEPECVQLICSYLFPDKPAVHLNDLYYRPKDETKEYWTLPYVEGKRMPDVPVYVLTSSFTFSGAEEFAYNLQTQKRGVIVGEVTGGGSHPGDVKVINENFVMFTPEGRAINPVTKTNWEGTGVTPDIIVPQDMALEKARVLALERIAEKTTDEVKKNFIKWSIDGLKAELSPLAMDESAMRIFTGKYGERNVMFENGTLYYQRTGRPKYKMAAMNEDTFMLIGLDYFRVKFVKDASGTVTALTGLYDDGHTDNSPKTE